MQAYVYHEDPGHGWLEVPTAQVRALGVKVTTYSYQSGDGLTMYLEEDLDMSRFLHAMDATGQAYEIKPRYHHGSAFVRNLNAPRILGGMLI